MIKSFSSFCNFHHRFVIKPLEKSFQRLISWGLLLSLLTLNACSTFQVEAQHYDIRPTEYDKSTLHLMAINGYLLHQKKHKKLPITELSDLAWDNDNKLLYAISDEGILYSLRLILENNAIKQLTVTSAKKLLNKKNIPLTGKFSDAEGLDIINGNNGIKNDAQLLIAFENKPRIAIYSTDGRFIKKVKSIKKLRKRRYFRHKNKALESVIHHPQHGVLTAAELPLKENTLNRQSIYSTQGKEWHFDATMYKNSAITALETLNNGDILILERAYNGILSPIIITLRQLKINECNKNRYCKTKTLATLDSSEGWRIDNFEGLTQLNTHQYLMVSDNNGNPLQKTIFVLFNLSEQ